MSIYFQLLKQGSQEASDVRGLLLIRAEVGREILS